MGFLASRRGGHWAKLGYKASPVFLEQNLGSSVALTLVLAHTACICLGFHVGREMRKRQVPAGWGSTGDIATSQVQSPAVCKAGKASWACVICHGMLG